MAMGRGSARLTTSSLLLCSVMLFSVMLLEIQMVHAAIYPVGGNAGWTFTSGSWPKGKRFKAGDVLVFKYNPSFHNVVRVNAAGYKSCKTPRGAQVFKSGKDSIKLKKGQNYFICNFTGHCESGMKFAINAM